LFKKFYYCPLKDNRQGEDAGDCQPYRRVDARDWSADALEHGKCIQIKGFPKEHKMPLFRVVVSTHHTDSMVTNELTQHATEATQGHSIFVGAIDRE